MVGQLVSPFPIYVEFVRVSLGKSSIMISKEKAEEIDREIVDFVDGATMIYCVGRRNGNGHLNSEVGIAVRLFRAQIQK